MLSNIIYEAEEQKAIQIIGFKKVLKKYFLSKAKKVRNMNNITYRILSFIFYSCIFYNEKIKNINFNYLSNFYYEDSKEDCSILKILIDSWNILSEELFKRDIDNIQIFINMIIPDISKLIIENSNAMTESEVRNNFEELCNQIIERAINNYTNYYPVYINNNKEILQINDDTIKSILQETTNFNNLSKDDYPLIQYFYAASYPSYEGFYKEFYSLQDNLKYPVLANYLKSTQENSEKIKLLQNFHLINPLITYSLEKYSNKISRKEAKEIIIKNELENDKYMKKLFINFKKGWKNIYQKLSNYDCSGKLPEMFIEENKCLSYILNDYHENNYGKYISTVYKDFITYQNEIYYFKISRK
ncbi:hypothetical protein BCR36DRAFT_579480 [Piromyces finnis]|uniref:Uncharacterized protein n=1 Tax=Piromyces finnis TaxID=1754191 RepID=A0A1Y1VMN2_9FUNG|nr:hypothetical protein BCR36DRAFT_579480 [Piromyces finnis]|eukprot:ORX60039.1 hypothetical protein BCR36DRAFT_579480 [Piromyces finnis]